MAIATAPAKSGLRAWLLADAPGNAFQARCQRAYLAWVVFRGNPIAMAGLIIYGSLLPVHIRRAWAIRRNIFLGIGLVLFMAINMVELLPNSTLPPWTWLIAGSLVGSAYKRPANRSRPVAGQHSAALLR